MSAPASVQFDAIHTAVPVPGGYALEQRERNSVRRSLDVYATTRDALAAVLGDKVRWANWRATT